MLAGREGLTRLLCGEGFVPARLPPNLEFLVVCLEGPDASLHLSSALSVACELPHLFELKVWLSGCSVSLPDPFPCLSSLCYLTLCYEYGQHTRLQRFQALRLAAADEILVACEVRMCTAESTASRQRLWAALACVHLEELRLSLESVSVEDAASPAELQQLGAVHCGQLVLSDLLGSCFVAQLLHTLHAPQLCLP